MFSSDHRSTGEAFGHAQNEENDDDDEWLKPRLSLTPLHLCVMLSLTV